MSAIDCVFAAIIRQTRMEVYNFSAGGVDVGSIEAVIRVLPAAVIGAMRI